MKNAGKACNNRLYRHIRTFEKIVKNYFVIYKEILETSNNLSPYQRSRGYSYKITYFETTHDEKRCLEIYEEILYVFGIDVTIRTDERKIRLLVDSIDFQWIDTNADKMQITIDFADTVQIGGRTETEDIAESCETVVRKESEGE